MIIDVRNNSYPNPPDDGGHENECQKCGEKYDTAYSTAYEYETFCSSQCETIVDDE